LTANEGETPEELAERQKKANEDYRARYKKAQDDLAAAQKAYADAKRAREIFYLEQKAEDEREAHDKERENKRARFEEDLAELARWAAKNSKKHKELLERIKELWREYGIQGQNWGRNLGEKIAQGLRDAIPEIVKAAQEVAEAIKKNTKPGSPTKEGPLSTFDMRDAGFDLMAGYAKGIRDGARAIGPSFSGGMARGGGLAMAGGGGGQVIHTHVYLNGREIATAVTRQQFATRRYGGELPSSA
jgi:hypothetical protein